MSTMTKADWLQSKYFKEYEFVCRERNGNVNVADKMDKDFIMKFLNPWREACGFPITIESSYRTPVHNQEVHGAKDSAHTHVPCKAIDPQVKDSHQRFIMVREAMKLGCVRIGFYPGGGLHFDFDLDNPQEVMWFTVSNPA